MRHILAARAVAAGPLGMREAPAATGLVARAGGTLAAAPRVQRAVTSTVDLATVAAAADQHLLAAVGADEQSQRRRLAVLAAVNAWWTYATITGILTPHACPARCGARRR